MKQLLARAACYPLVWVCLGGLASGQTTIPGKPAKAGPDPAVKITVVGEPQVVYRWADHACDIRAIPDAPARAFKDDEGHVRLIAGSNVNWSMVGPNLNTVKTDCHPLLLGAEAADPGAFDDLPWIEATYTLDNKRVVALFSNEWNAFRHQQTALAHDSECTDPHQQRCYFYAITQALSVDGGKHFTYQPSIRIAAALPTKFRREPGWTAAQGFATVSNIFPHEDYFYVFVGSRGGGAQAAGNCLMRTRDLFDPASWRAWDGHDFTVRFGNPYEANSAPAENATCRTIPIPADQTEEVRSLSWDPASKVFIAVVRGQLKPAGSNEPVAGFFYSTSPDLLHWSRAGLLMKLNLQSECKPLLFYPSILDPVAKGANFDEVTAHPYVYYTRFAIAPDHCGGTMDRDLVRSALEITPTGK